MLAGRLLPMATQVQAGLTDVYGRERNAEILSRSTVEEATKHIHVEDGEYPWFLIEEEFDHDHTDDFTKQHWV